MDKIRIGKNEYTLPFTYGDAGFICDSNGNWLDISETIEVLNSLNELATLRAEVEKLRELFRLEHSGQTISNDGFRRINELVKLIKESPDEAVVGEKEARE